MQFSTVDRSHLPDYARSSDPAEIYLVGLRRSLVSFYGYDGGGTVRFLTDTSGTVTDTYDYDAWGNVVNSTGSTPNAYFYSGEQYDSDLSLYYFRAR